MNDEGSKIKLWITVGVLVVVLVLAGWLARSPYRHFRERHDATQAQAFFDRGDYRNALLSARQALQVNSNNVTACRVMARLADLSHSTITLDWWQRVVKLSPTTDNQLALADAGLRYQSPPFPLATEVLSGLSNSAARIPDFHILSAELALALHDMAGAETQFAAACQLAPTNRLFQLNLAVIRLASTNPAVADGARVQLKQFSSDPNLGPAALRSLLAERLLHNDASAALGFSTQLLACPQANLNDRLQNLVILQRLHSPELAGRMKSLQETTATNAVMAAQLAGWMSANGFRAEATDWLNRLPAGVQAQPPVRLALADAYLTESNWTALRDFAAKGSWGEAEFLRFAFLSRAWSQLGEPLVADGNWRSAVNLAANQLGTLNALLELAGRWGMPRAQEDLLWRIMRKFPDATWAQHDLEGFYLVSGNTAGLHRLYTELLARSPQNVELKNNVAFVSLLLKTNLSQACQWAAEIYAQRPNDPPIVSTYAYALHLQSRDRDGLAALQKLTEAERSQPSVALYYGVLLSAVGESNQAAPYLKIAQTRGRFLPEEKQLPAETLK